MCFCLTGVLSYLETSARDFIPGGPDSWRLEKDTFFWGLKQVKITHKTFSQNNKKLKPYSSLTVLSFAVKIRRIDGDIFFFSFLKNSGLPFNVVTVSICSSCFHGGASQSGSKRSLFPSSLISQLLTKDVSATCLNGHLSQEAALPTGNSSIWRSLWGVLCRIPSFNETSVLNERLLAVKHAVSIHH